ncbi:conserved hypothetical protein [Burkholderia sp. 8Y]|uniref:DUF1353 domain-containing protein n=1 Tax=Burkholderia sp. 8Y TaxID=2653133 RepID=UPI0012EEF001|nr:DUF1353 domain-containing protein [Burkholderia sp. 8Y]VXB26116.1 conserved hypothetical protein [Burkholderia sp. 8Y]
MSGFVAPYDKLDADLIKDEPATWRLNEPLVYQSDVAGQTFTVPAGFVTDLASTPRIPVVYEIAGGAANMASVVHDFLYASHPVTRGVADSVLREASLATGVAKWRARLMFYGVRLFGARHWQPGERAAV